MEVLFFGSIHLEECDDPEDLVVCIYFREEPGLEDEEMVGKVKVVPESLLSTFTIYDEGSSDP